MWFRNKLFSLAEVSLYEAGAVTEATGSAIQGVMGSNRDRRNIFFLSPNVHPGCEAHPAPWLVLTVDVYRGYLSRDV